MANPTNIKWEVKDLQRVYNTDTLKLFFKEELDFIAANSWRFMHNLPAIIDGINSGGLSFSHLLEVKRLMEGEKEQTRLKAIEDARIAQIERDSEEAKAKYLKPQAPPSVAQMTDMRSAPWRQ
jgi:hypothetical protein